MRVNKSFDKGYKFILLASIIVCAIIAFSATLISVTDSSAIKNYAFAATYIDSVTPSEEGSVTLGSASLINGDTGRSLTASDFGFPGTNASATSWSYTETLKKVVPAKNNFSAYRQDGSKNKTFFINGTTGKFQFGSESYYDDVNNYMVINLDLGKAGSFLNNLLTNSMYKISVKVSATITAYCQNAATLDNEMYTYLGAKVSDGGLTASEVSDSEWSSTYAYVEDGTKTVDASVTLNNISKSVLSITSRGFYDKEWWSTGNVTYTSTVENISVVITISRDTSYTYSSSTIKNDGGDPIVATTLSNLSSSFIDGQKGTTAPSGSGYAPYITSADTSAGWPMYDSDLKSTLSKNLDNVTNGSGDLKSYTNTKLGDINGTAYYKYSQVEYVDTYNYLFNNKTLSQLIDGVEETSSGETNISLASINKYAGAGDKYPTTIDKDGKISWGTGNEHFASGIKSVTVGDTTLDVSGGSAGATIMKDSVAVGYAYVYKINNARVVVQIYAYQNAKIITKVNDYGSGNCSNTITFAGIDTTKPYETATPSFSSEDEVISYGYEDIQKWVRTSKLTVSVEENFYIVDNNNVDDGAPYVWFYTVKKSNTSAEDIPKVQTFSNYADMVSIGLRPIAVSEFSEFIYNFEDGTAKGITSGSQISGKGTKDTSEVTGSGYYRFTFYVCDLAGNLINGAPVSFYVKVDYETPYSTTTLTTDKSVSITSANNGLWADCAETLKIDLLKNNISGNTLVFETGDETNPCNLVFDSSKIISLNGSAVNANSIATTISGTLNSAEITITHSSNGKGGTFITISIPSSSAFAWEAAFIMYAGLDINEYGNPGPNIEEVSFDKSSFVKDSTTYSGINFKSPIKVYIDNASPAVPTAYDYEEIGYLKKVANKDALTLNIAGTRTWFTQANMKMDSILNFDDTIIGTEFDQGLKVYYGVKTITNDSSFTSVKNFIDAYKTKSLGFDTDSYKSYFDRTQIYLGSGLNNGESDMLIDFIQKDGSNMRVLVLWAIDQAGNRTSDVSIYYVLADPTVYKVNAACVDNTIGNAPKFELLDDDDVSSVTFSRGSTITLSYEFNKGYVPYQTILVGSTTSLLLSNYTSDISWNIEKDYQSLITQGSIDETTITMKYLFDDPSKFSGLDTSLTFKVAQRKVVGYTVTNTSVRYTGLPTIVPMTYSDSNAEESFVYTFRNKGSTVNLASTPIIPGEYEVQVAIPIDNPSFVLEKVQIVYDKTKDVYEQNVAFISYTITKGIVTVKATATSSYYGEYPSLNSTVEGIDSAVYATLTKKGSLKLNVTGVEPESYNTLKVGSYAIVEAVPFEIENCIVTFESNYHEILQKIIQVEIDNNSKEYGESDKAYKYWVNFTDSGLNNVKEMTDLLNCGANLDNKYENGKYYYQYASSLFIEREAGELVGTYKYINNPSAFVLSNPNYAISIIKMGTFTINKKVIKIDATNQSYVFESAIEAEKASNLQGLKINYSLGKYSQYSTQITDLFDSKKLELGLDLDNMADVIAAKTDVSTTDYQYKYVYNLKLTVDPNASDNFTFELSSNPTTMDIYSAKANTIIVKLKDSVKIELVYGQAFSTILSSLKYDATTQSKFDVSGCGAIYGTNFNSIEWTAKIDIDSAELSYPEVSKFTGYLNVGTYNIICTNPVMKMNGGAATGITGSYTVVVIPFPIYVVPAVVEIEPSVEAGKESKTYAQPDSNYGIGIKIKTINGNSVATLDSYGTSSISGIKDTIEGSFVRAIYDQDGNFVAFGSKNDSASDKNGVVLGGTNYYSFAIYQEFSSTNIYGNYVVKATIDKTKRLVINPYTITISVNDFKGISKVYDGTDDVIYGTNNKAVDIALKLAVPTDDVNVLFIAKYISFEDGTPSALKGHKSIKFSTIVLDGAQSTNYTLVITDKDSKAIDLSEGFKIDYLTYKAGGSYSQADWILIKDGEINILRSDFTIQKEYDNLVTLSLDDIKLVNRTDDNGRGTAMLYGAKANMQITHGVFPDKKVSKNYAITLELFFPLGMDVTDKIVATDTTITVESIEKDGVWGVRVLITNIGAEITKRNLDYSDFEYITANNRDYNSTSEITFSYKLKQSAVAAGDEALLKEQYITISGATKTGEVNVGTYDTVFSGYKIENSTFNSHYSVDIASLNSNFIGSKKIEVTIDYAKLLPRVDFTSREYAGSTNSNITFVDRYNSLDSSSSMLKTLNYTEELIEELKRFTYTMTDPLSPYKYSLNGVANGDVQVDKDGNVLLHNVLVTGLTITETGSANYLKNYVVYGGRYNSATKAYEDVGAVNSGLLIADYEMFNVAGLTKKNLTIFGNDIDVDNKVYDGTKNASINVKLDGSDAIEEDKEYLAVIATATYAKKQVGENTNVTVRVSQLVLKDANDTTHANLLNNYQLTAFTQKMQRSILARPVGFSVSIKDRVYNGSETITKDLIKYDLSQMINDDAKNYSVNTEKGAYYLNKDVNLKYYTQLSITEYDSSKKYYTYDSTTKTYNEDTTVTSKNFADKCESGLYVSNGENAGYSQVTITKFDSSQIYYTYDSTAKTYKADKTVTSDNFKSKCESGLYIYEITILDKEATAYNPILNNSKEKYINYTLSVVVDITKEVLPAKGTFFAYQDKKGNIYYGTDCLIQTKSTDEFKDNRTYYQYSTTTGYSKIILDSSTFGAGYYYIDEDVQYLYYPLNSSDKYITVAAFNALSDADKQIANASIVGFYIYNNQNVYILDSNYSGTCSTMSYEVKYVQGLGKVTQRQVAVTSVSQLKSEKFTKYYDGTTKFYGENGVDYEFNSSAITNDIASDHLTVENVTAQFKVKNAGLTQVEFTATGITTELGYTDYSFNYSSKSSSSTNKTATIKKRTIYACLQDATMIYGTALSNVDATIKYYIKVDLNKDGTIKAVDEENEIKVVDGKWLVKFSSFCTVCEIDFANLEDKYKEELKAKRYKLDSGKYVEDANGDYYMINDITYDTKGNIDTNNIVAPVKDIIVSGTKQEVGYIAERFGLKGGSATNFEFHFVYTGNGKNSYSKLEVVKKTLYVVAEYRTYSREYGKDLAANAVKVNLLNELYKDGIVSGETSQDVYKGTLTVEFRKVSTADIKNIAKADAVTSISLINVSSGKNQGLDVDGTYYYVAYIKQSEDFSSKNYDLKFGSIYYDDSEKKFKYSFEESTFSTQVPELEIKLPSITGVSLSNTELETVYNKKEQASSLVKGLTTGDTVTIGGSEATDVNIIDGKVCAYEGMVVVTRKLIANELGISYVITQELGNAKLTITKASAGLFAKKQTVKYDKNDHKVSSLYYGVTDTGSSASDDSFEVRYYLNGDEIDMKTTSLTEAGTYTYVVKFTSTNSSNYMDEEKSAEFVITPAKINVVLAAETRLTQEYVPGTKYSIKYSVEDEMGIGVELAHTKLVFYKNGVEVKDGIFNEAGRYKYVISLTEEKQNEFESTVDNEYEYNILMNNNTGFLDLTVSQIVSYDSDSKQVAQLELKNQGDSLLVDKFSTRYVSSSNDLAEDDAYWASINQYMSAIEKQIGAGATLTSVVRMTLTYGLNTQSLSSKDAIVTVSLPENVDSSLDGYVVYQTTAGGTLVEIKASEYTLSNGTITYSTNYLGSLVFVKLGDPELSTAAKVAIGVCVPAFVLTVLGLVAVTLIKKKKLKAGL